MMARVLSPRINLQGSLVQCKDGTQGIANLRHLRIKDHIDAFEALGVRPRAVRVRVPHDVPRVKLIIKFVSRAVTRTVP